MRKKIQDLAHARFQAERPEIRIGTEVLEFEVLLGEVYQGSIQLVSTNEIPVRGTVTSLNSRIKILNPDFEGTNITIQFEFCTDGLEEGDKQSGDFTIISNGGEYNLSFVANVTKFYAVSTIGKIKNLFDFANLAQESYEEAFRIFQAPFFQNLMKETEVKERLLYRALKGKAPSMQGMEEFLIGIRKKQRVFFRLEQEEIRIDALEEDFQETIQIKKEQWGYLDLLINSDHPAVVPVKKRVTTDDFVGNNAELDFIIKPQFLHAGNNFVRISIRSLYQQKYCVLCINKRQDTNEADRKLRLEKKKLQQNLTRLYLDFRMQKIVTGVWTKESSRCLDRLKELEPDNLWYVLYQAQTLLINKQRQEAEWILDGLSRKEMVKDTPLYAYYLYLTTLQVGETAYLNKVWGQIQEIYHKNQEDMRLFLIMLFTDPQLNQSKSRKLSAIEEKVQQGMNSPLLYMEAYLLIRNDVYLLHKMDSFEMQVLHWAAREQALVIPVVNHLNQCMIQVRQYHPMWIRILECCYQVYPEQETLQNICSCCIKWNLNTGEYFKWYDKGIHAELRIAGLYEAWLESADTVSIEQFPRNVMIYFQYHSNLNYKKQALLYATIIKHKSNQKNLYETYQKNIERFAIEQLLAGHMDENLAVLYRDALKNLAVNEELSDALAEVLYMHKFVCKDCQAAYVVVVHHELKQEQRVPVNHLFAQIQLYSESYCILLEDEYGRRYMPMDICTCQPYMQSGGFLEKCLSVVGNGLPHLIHYFEGHRTAHSFQEQDLPLLLKLMNAEAISTEYKNEMKPQMIEYGYYSYSGNDLDIYLRQVEMDGLPRVTRNKLMELMIARGICDRAYEMLLIFGCEQASASKLLFVAEQQVCDREYQYDRELLGLCATIFARGKYNQTVLQYLCNHFRGNNKEMERLWRAAREFDINTYELEERFLVQLLYTEGYTERMDEIFRNYFNSKGQEMIILAYLSWFSYQYFVKGAVVSEHLFACIQQQLMLENPLNDSCRLAYMLWLTCQKKLTERQQYLLDDNLQFFLKRGMQFAFYQNLPENLRRKYQLHDRRFLEYRTNPDSKVVISYCQNDTEYQEEEMIQMYEGIFVKEFVVFFGEEIPYFMKEIGKQEEEITESGHIPTREVMHQGAESRYELLNDMTISYHVNDKKTLRQLYMQYLNKEKETEERFSML